MDDGQPRPSQPALLVPAQRGLAPGSTAARTITSSPEPVQGVGDQTRRRSL